MSAAEPDAQGNLVLTEEGLATLIESNITRLGELNKALRTAAENPTKLVIKEGRPLTSKETADFATALKGIQDESDVLRERIKKMMEVITEMNKSKPAGKGGRKSRRRSKRSSTRRRRA